MYYKFQETYRGYDISKHTEKNYYTVLDINDTELCQKESLDKMKRGIDFEIVVNEAESIMV